MFTVERRTYRLTGITPILGSNPADPAIHTKFVSAKAPSEWQQTEEDGMLPADADKGVTVFLRAPNGSGEALCLREHMILGFFKSAAGALKAQVGLVQHKSKIDQYLFCRPTNLLLTRDGVPIIEEDSVLERPLRAQTMQGPRVALASSEQVDDPWEITMELTLVPNEGSAKSRALSWETIETCLDYGALNGLGQWRNGGYGRFTWERVSEQ